MKKIIFILFSGIAVFWSVLSLAQVAQSDFCSHAYRQIVGTQPNPEVYVQCTDLSAPNPGLKRCDNTTMQCLCYLAGKDLKSNAYKLTIVYGYQPADCPDRALPQNQDGYITAAVPQ